MKIRAHETFCIRKGWLHKGVKNIIENPRLFTNKELNPIDILGIGSNMVKSLRYWLSAVGVTKEINDGIYKILKLTELGQIIDRFDKYYEEDGTNWLIHYKLASNEQLATSWYWFFNIFNFTTFNKNIFVDELSDYLKTTYNYNGSIKMLEDDFDCIIKTYCTKDKEVSPEETNECPLVELKLIEDCGDKEYRKTSPDKDAIHPLILFAVICDRYKKDEILIADLIDDINSVGRIFNLDRSVLYYLLEQLQKMNKIEITRTAGLDVIKIKCHMSFYDAVESYYKAIN